MEFTLNTTLKQPVSRKRILIVGFGKLGKPLAQNLAKHHEVWTLHRHPNEEVQGIHSIGADVTDIVSLHENIPSKLDFIVYCLSPGSRSEEAYRNIYPEGLANTLQALPEETHLQRLYFISSTSVYHQNDHSWVDENSPAEATSYSGRLLLEAESVAENSGQPATVIRFSGIYGGDRRRLIDQVKNRQAGYSPKTRLSNRIHQDDCVGFIEHLIQQECAGEKNLPRYLASDSCPVDLNEVLGFLAEKLGVELQESSETPSTRRGGNKRCSNRQMLASGYRLRYPDYRAGYAAQLGNDDTNG